MLKPVSRLVSSLNSLRSKPLLGSPRLTHAFSSSAQTLVSSKPPTKKHKNQKPVVVVYHNPGSAASVKLLSILRRAQIAYPQTQKRTGPPLEFELKILERLPTVEELQDMYSLLNESSWTIFRSKNITSNYRRHPTSARSLLDLIDLEHQEEIAKAKLNSHDNPVLMAPPTDTSPANSSADELPENKLTILDINHPLFGTQSFPWPVMVCWDAKRILVGLRFKNVERLLKDFANERDDVKSVKQVKEEAEKAWQATWHFPEKEVSPAEEDTLQWFKDLSNKKK